MAPLPFNSTSVLFVDYTVCGYQHTIQMRFDGDENVADAMVELDAFLDALGNSIYATVINGARFQAEGQDVTQDVTWTGNPAYGVGAGIPADTAYFYDFIGRSQSGRRVRVSIFGAKHQGQEGLFRLPETADAAFSGALGVLRSAEGTFLAIDGQQPVWKRYVNLGPNAYWRNKVR